MKERPILFSAPMVRALLAGTKTQTRRALRPQPESVKNFGRLVPYRLTKPPRDMPSAVCSEPIPCPYGVPGDVLWVRENFRAEQGRCDGGLMDGDGVTYSADGSYRPIENTAEAADRWLRIYHYDPKRRPPASEIPSIHMPRWASRITLKITDVRVERLNDISEADATAEGVSEVMPRASDGMRSFGVEGMPESRSPICCHPTAARAYRFLWDHINGPGSWAANPWVWAVSFEVQA